MAEGKRVNDTLKAFQAKFEYQLKTTEANFAKEMEDERKYTHGMFDHINSELYVNIKRIY